MNKDDIIHKLSQDTCFGILTRPAIELKFKDSLVSGFLLDINNMKKMNGLIGYSDVNNIVKNWLSEFKSEDIIIGRWFCGDEIIFVCDNIEYILAELREAGHERNITFKYNIFKNKSISYLAENFSKCHTQ